jgi:Ran GTPase-activating protein (RanGAP) involved in mRNA processing and transport
MTQFQLKTFKINNIKISNEVLGQLVKTVLTDCFALQSLRLSNIRIGQEPKNLALISLMLKNLQTLKHLNLQNCFLSAKGLS